MVKSLLWNEIVQLIQSTKRELVLIIPAIHEEWMDVIEGLSLSNKELELRFCIDNSDSVVRKGYGAASSVDRLLGMDHEIVESDGLNITLLKVDEICYCIFLESRIFSGNPQGINAIELPKDIADKIICQFFPEQAVQSSSSVLSVPLDKIKHEEVKKLLQANPPAKPDLTRQINTYKTHFQYAEIHFQGVGIQSKTVTIPKEALPYKSENLKSRLRSSFNLFSKEEIEEWSEMNEMKQKIADLRKKYLHTFSLKKGRSIIKKSDKVSFKKELEKLREFIEEKKEKLQESVQRSLLNSEDILKGELKEFFNQNPPDELEKIANTEIKDRTIDKMITKILGDINLPFAHELIQNMKIEVQYAEFTEEDLESEEFLKWFKEQGLLDENGEKEIASYSTAYKVDIS